MTVSCQSLLADAVSPFPFCCSYEQAREGSTTLELAPPQRGWEVFGTQFMIVCHIEPCLESGLRDCKYLWRPCDLGGP